MPNHFLLMHLDVTWPLSRVTFLVEHVGVFNFRLCYFDPLVTTQFQFEVSKKGTNILFHAFRNRHQNATKLVIFGAVLGVQSGQEPQVAISSSLLAVARGPRWNALRIIFGKRNTNVYIINSMYEMCSFFLG